jgi:nickel transport system permease protein
MTRLVAQRVLDTLPLLFCASIVAFLLLALAPGDPAQKIATQGGPGEVPDPAVVAALRQELGLDRPLPERYVRWLFDVAHLDLGVSYVSKRPVAEILGERLPPSLLLATVSLAIGVLISVPLGIASALRRGTLVDALIRPLSLAGAAMPAFWVALLAIWLFAAELHWLPALGAPTAAGIVLPAGVLALRSLGLLTRLTRAAMLDALDLPHVVVAHGKGLPPRTVVLRHVLRNASAPIVAAIALDFAAFVAHAAVIEWVFAWPGIGRTGVEAAIAGDMPLLLGFVLVAGAVVIVANLVADLIAAIGDPRLRER